MVKRLNTKDQDFCDQFDLFLESFNFESVNIEGEVRNILEDVCLNGNNALIKYSKKFDNLDLSIHDIKVNKEEISFANKSVDKSSFDALSLASKRIFEYHKDQLPENKVYRDDEDVVLGSRWSPISSVGIYVPGGTASYPSSVLMNAIPAKVAGVKKITMTVPAPKNYISPEVLVAANLAGVDQIYKLGGAQAIGALTYGTETIESVDKIVGPGNSYVTSAKKLVFGRVGIDLIAGPSEILIVADSEANPSWISADLLAQAEHDPDSKSILICENSEYADKVEASLNRQIKKLRRSEIAEKSWQNNGLIIIVEDIYNSGPLIDKIAPEHVELALSEPERVLNSFSNAGAIFFGNYTPGALGDYVAGPNHVLPTSRASRFASGLSVLDFVKRSSVVSCNSISFNKIGPSAIKLAEIEGLTAHALSLSLRISKLKE